MRCREKYKKMRSVIVITMLLFVWIYDHALLRKIQKGVDYQLWKCRNVFSHLPYMEMENHCLSVWSILAWIIHCHWPTIRYVLYYRYYHGTMIDDVMTWPNCVRYVRYVVDVTYPSNRYQCAFLVIVSIDPLASITQSDTRHRKHLWHIDWITSTRHVHQRRSIFRTKHCISTRTIDTTRIVAFDTGWQDIQSRVFNDRIVTVATLDPIGTLCIPHVAHWQSRCANVTSDDFTLKSFNTSLPNDTNRSRIFIDININDSNVNNVFFFLCVRRLYILQKRFSCTW